MVNEVWAFVLCALAVWRLTSLLYREDGPFDMFPRLRKWVGVYYDEHSVMQGRNVVARAMTCFWCLSLWVSLPFSMIVPHNSVNIHPLAAWWIIWLALSTAAIVIDSI